MHERRTAGDFVPLGLGIAFFDLRRFAANEFFHVFLAQLGFVERGVGADLAILAGPADQVAQTRGRSFPADLAVVLGDDAQQSGQFAELPAAVLVAAAFELGRCLDRVADFLLQGLDLALDGVGGNQIRPGERAPIARRRSTVGRRRSAAAGHGHRAAPAAAGSRSRAVELLSRVAEEDVAVALAPARRPGPLGSSGRPDERREQKTTAKPTTTRVCDFAFIACYPRCLLLLLPFCRNPVRLSL